MTATHGMLESPRGLEAFLTDAIRQGLLQRALEQVERKLKKVQDDIAKQVSENVDIVIRSFTTNSKLQLLLRSSLKDLEKLKTYKYKKLLDCYDQFNRESHALESDLNTLKQVQQLKIYIHKILEIQKKIYDFKINIQADDACLFASKKFSLKENGTPLSPSSRLQYLRDYYQISENIQLISRQLYVSDKITPDTPSQWLLQHCTFLLKQIHTLAQAELYFTLSRGVEYPLQPELLKASFSLLEKSGIFNETLSEITSLKASETCNVINSKEILNASSPSTATTTFMEQFLIFLDIYCCSVQGFYLLDRPNYTSEFIDKVTATLSSTFSGLYKRQKFRQGMVETIPKLARIMHSYHEKINENLQNHLYMVFEQAIKDYLCHVLNVVMPLVNGFFSGIRTTSPVKALECLPTENDLSYFSDICAKYLEESRGCGQIEVQVRKIIQTAVQTFANSISTISQMSTESIQFEFHHKGGFGFAEPTPFHLLGARLFCITLILQRQLRFPESPGLGAHNNQTVQQAPFEEIFSMGTEVVKKWVSNLAKDLKVLLEHRPCAGLETSEELSRNICSLFHGLKLYFNNSLFSKQVWDSLCDHLSPLVYHSVFLYISLSISAPSTACTSANDCGHSNGDACDGIEDQCKLALVQQAAEIEMAISDLLTSPLPKRVADLLLQFKRFLFSENDHKMGEQIDLLPEIAALVTEGVKSHDCLFDTSYKLSFDACGLD